MDTLCCRLCILCGAYFDSCQVRHPEHGFYGGHGGADGGNFDIFLADCVDRRLRESGFFDFREDLSFSDPFRAATGASWLCYFRALQIGDINKVVPVDKSSAVLNIILALIFLHEGISLPKAIAVLAIAAGIFLMIEKKDGEEKRGKGGWFFWAAGSALFASLTAILGKIGISGVE